MAITVGNSTNASSTTVTKPASVSTGDSVYVAVAGTGSGFSISGFTNEIEISGVAYTVAILSRVLDGSEGSTWTLGGGTPTGNIALALRPGSGNTLVLDGTPTSNSAGNGSTATCGAITLANTNDVLMTAFASSPGAHTPPGGMTEIADFGGAVGMSMDYQAIASSGSTGTRAATSAGIRMIGVMLAVKEVTATVNVNVSDSGTITSTESKTITVSRSISDTGTITSTETSSRAISGSYSDSGTITSTETSSRAISGSYSDSGTITSTETSSLTVSRSVSDSGTITSVESVTIAMAVSDSGTLSSVETMFLSTSRSVSDTGLIGSTETRSGTAALAVSDSGLITGTDTQTQAVSRSVSDSGTITSVETTVRSAVISVSDTGTLVGTDTVSTTTSRTVSDSGLLSSIETSGLTVSFSVSDSGTITAVLSAVAGLYVPAERIGGLSRVLGNFNVIAVTREGVALSIGTARIPHAVVFQAHRIDPATVLGITREESTFHMSAVRDNPALNLAVARMFGVEDVHVHRVIFEDLTD